MTSFAHRKGMTAGIVEERQRVLALIDCGLSLERLRVAIFDGESAEEFEGVVAARDGTNPSADLQPILSPSVRDSVLKPCPFCSVQMIHVAGKPRPYWRHPHPTECMISGITITPSWLPKWNRRPSPCAGTGNALVERAKDAAQRCHRPVLTAEDRIDLQVVFLDCAAALSTGVGRGGVDEIERSERLIRKLCNKAPDSPGCRYPDCDCGTAIPLDE